MSLPRFSPVLFDFDGTIVDTAPGIVTALAATLDHFGLPAEEPSTLRNRIGPPLPEIVASLTGFVDEQLTEAIAFYRAQRGGGLAGIQNSEIFPGMLELILELKAAGVPLGIATSRPQHSAENALNYFELTSHFTAVVGSDEDAGRKTKGDVVAEALRQLRAAGAEVDPARTLLLGDRIHDAEGGAEHGINVLLVDWGYGTEAEAAGTLGYARGPEDVRKVLFG